MKRLIRYMALVLSVSALGSCGSLSKFESADDDVYFSSKNSGHRAVMIPKANVDSIMRVHPSRVNENQPSNRLYDGSTPNPNAALGYRDYKAKQDSLYKLHPELSGYYQPYSMPPYSLADEAARHKAERRHQRRLARINNRSIYNSYWNSSFGASNFYSPWYMPNRFNNFGWPSYGFGWNSNTGWNLGFGCNMGWNNWNNWGWCDPWYSSWNSPYGFYSPWNNWYAPPVYYMPQNNEAANNPGPVSKPRQVMGSNLPATNGGTVDNPNPNQRILPNGGVATTNPNTTQLQAPAGNGGTLVQSPTGPQYVAPVGFQGNINPQAYGSYTRSTETQPYRQAASGNTNENQVMQRNVQPYSVQPASPQNQPRQNYRGNPDVAPAPVYNPPPPSSPAPQAPPAPAYSAPRGNGGGGGSAPMQRPR